MVFVIANRFGLNSVLCSEMTGRAALLPKYREATVYPVGMKREK